jgi:transcriptional regulator with GAF, ATPase, and Fis domain
MIDLIKDRFRLSLVLAVLFLCGIFLSVYHLYRLPSNLMMTDAMHPALMNIYIIPGITFFIGALALYLALNYRAEVIVFRDKQMETDAQKRDSSNENQHVISLESVSQTLKSAKSEKDILHSGLQAICKQLEAGQGALYLIKDIDGKRKLELQSGYALNVAESAVITFEVGEGLIGQAAATGRTVYLDDIPDGYIKIISGLGSASPRHLLMVSLKKGDRVIGTLELASFAPLNEHQRKFVEDAATLIAEKVSGN